MIIVEKSSLNDIPLLHIVHGGKQKERLPLIIFVHGITSAKENNLHYAYLLAEKGFRVILPEALYHGEREKVSFSKKDLYAHFWKIVIQTIHELADIKEYYIHEGLADRERIGLAGTSMGGIVTLGALTQYNWIKTAVSLMGMPSYEKFSYWQMDLLKSQGFELPLTVQQITEQLTVLRRYDLSLHPEKVDNRPILFWHGKKDPVVPYHLTYQFYQSIKDNSDHICFITDEHADHKVSREGIMSAVEWFEKYL